MPDSSSTLPYHGIRILDFSQVIAGPIATHLLNASGADVIKIEAPAKGDQLRKLVFSSRQDKSRDSAAFTAINRGKRSICLDLKSPAGQEVAMRMAGASDVIVENFRPGVMQRLGLDYASIVKNVPNIIYCSVSGYGQSGPLSKRPAYDSAIQAASGMMASTGHPETGPTRTGYTPVDASAGLLAAFALSSALLRRERTGLGQYLDVAMLDASMLLQLTTMTACLDDGTLGSLQGNISPAHSLTADCFEATDGAVLVSALTAAQGEAIMKCLELPARLWHEYMELAADSDAARAIKQTVKQAFAAKPVQHWVDQFEPLGVAFERVNRLDQAAELVRMQKRRMIDPASTDGSVCSYGGAFMASNDGPDCDGTEGPALGAHTQEILQAYGFKTEEISELQKRGAFGAI